MHIPKRFYQQAVPAQMAERWQILLDGRPVRTPGQHILSVPYAGLAERIAAEWAAQTGQIQPATMPMTQLAMTAIDRIPEQRAAIIEVLTGYAAHDLLCWRVAFPADLAAAQARLWDPVCQHLAHRHQISFHIWHDLTGGDQSPETLAHVRAFFEACNDWVLSALQVMVPALGSAGLAIGCGAGWLSVADACTAAMLEEHWQAGRWGQDAEAEQRRAAIAQEVSAAADFIRLCSCVPENPPQDTSHPPAQRK